MPRYPLILTLTLLLAACAGVPDFRARTSSSAPRPAPLPANVTMSTPTPFEVAPGSAGAPAAEAACTAAGRERGFEVQGVVGSTEVMGTDGQPASRDVMLRVARASQVFDLRCNYHYGSAQARVMAL